IRQLTIKKANITTRNFPKTVAEIRKKLSIAEGGERYLFFIRDLNENLMILECTKVA
ncbi:MAG: class I SAM-dependent methyltransferase, partial [Pricia sp.]|nr:class I SAM-dependent methyltransferase [Pricia sp.]